MSELLRLDRVTVSYRRRGRTPVTALRDADLCLSAGDLRFVYGPSGSGKSTLLLCAGGLLHPEGGTVTLCGKDLYACAPEARSALRAAEIGFVFQQFHLIPYLNVRDNILAPTLALTGQNADAGSDFDARADALIERFGLTHRTDHPPSELSIGERQRVALARALLNQPKLLLADEPTGNLDAENGERVIAHLRDFAREGGAVLIVSHDRNHRPSDAIQLENGVLRY